jgi:biopolymer transport protein ExbD
VKASLDLTPLIDVVYNLIIFFMLSSTFVVQTSIQIETPQAEGTETLENRDLSVTLQFGEGGPDGKGRVYVDNVEMTTWDELSKRLAEEVTKRPEALVLIRPDSRVETGRLVYVLGIATSAKVQRYAIAAVPPEEEK